MSSRSAQAYDDWDRVWDAYDARQARRQPAAPKPAPPRPTVTRTTTVVIARPRRHRGWLALLLAAPLLGGAAHWLGAPVNAARQTGQAIMARDAAALAPLLHQEAVQEAARSALAQAAARGPSGAQAQAFLAGMAAEMGAAWGSPKALAEVARARGVTQGAASEALRNLRPQGVTAVELPLGGAAPLTLRLELREAGLAPLWQVTEVRMEGGAQPVAPAPLMRLSALR